MGNRSKKKIEEKMTLYLSVKKEDEKKFLKDFFNYFYSPLGDELEDIVEKMAGAKEGIYKDEIFFIKKSESLFRGAFHYSMSILKYKDGVEYTIVNFLNSLINRYGVVKGPYKNNYK